MKTFLVSTIVILTLASTAAFAEDDVYVRNVVDIPGNTTHKEYISKEWEGRYEYEAHIHNTPSVNAYAPPPSAPCYLGVGLSGNAAGIGIGISGSVYDKECEVRETIRLAQSSNDPDTRAKANQVLNNRLDAYLVEDKRLKDSRDNRDVWAFQNL